jgi:hypothetical protein
VTVGDAIRPARPTLDRLDDDEPEPWHQPGVFVGGPHPALSRGARGVSPEALPLAFADEVRSARARTAVAVGAAGALASGAGGMVLSLLAMAGGLQAVMVGGFGFVGGAVLLSLGLVSLALVAARSPRGPEQGALAAARSPLPGDTLRTVAAVLAGLALLAGIGGMGLSFLVLAVGGTVEIVAGGAGFVAGALLVHGGGIAAALLGLEPHR